jgi:hypothetical protein
VPPATSQTARGRAVSSASRSASLPVAVTDANLGERPFTATVLRHQADAGLADDLAELAGEMTDELPLS